ncbi:MAG: ATP-binding cassette domain-containing protein [Lachnospiraceae bacterium]|nr:ATP-binding cassette domain-containing protein [Lachnospiraceae bacterium]
MAQINVTNLTYCYEGSFDNIFENVSFCIDTNWKLGFIGRNGKGKTTFLNILLGKYEYSGTVATSTVFDYFPYQITDQEMKMCASEFLERIKPGCEEWRVICELGGLNVLPELLYRPFYQLSHGERTKVLLAVLFSGDNDFLLIDEPTNHLDQEAREIVKYYLAEKKGFILVSHDWDLLDVCIDHVLVLNRKTIEVQSGNFSSWWENKMRKDRFEKTENEKHIKEIESLKKAVDKSGRWALKSENSKIGYDPVKEHDRSISTRSYIGAKTKKMQKKVKQYERRMEREIMEKEGLLKDVENPAALKLYPMTYHKECLITCKDAAIGYMDGRKDILKNFSFELMQGERVFLHGENGCGKSTFIKAVLSVGEKEREKTVEISEGEMQVGAGLTISYINQDTSFLKGDIQTYCEKEGLKESLFFALLRQLDLERVQFAKHLEDFSEGQKKKVLIASSLITPAHVYIWDEPLNYIDVFSRMQIEELLLKYQPTMIVVDHDIRFKEKIATRVVEL